MSDYDYDYDTCIDNDYFGNSSINCDCIYDECPISHLSEEEFKRYCVIKEQCMNGEI